MKRLNTKPAILASALGICVLALGTPVTAYSAELAAGKSSSGVSFGVYYDRSSRKVEQTGSGTLFSEIIDTEIVNGGTYSETISAFVNGAKGKEKQDQLYAMMSFAVTPRIELYGKLGMSKTRLSQMKGTFGFSLTETFSEDGGGTFSMTETESFNANFGTTSRGKWGTFFGIGAKANIHEWQASGLGLSLKLNYEFHKGRGKSGYLLKDRKSHELVGALVLEKMVGPFRPYGGVSVSKFKSEYDFAFGSGEMKFKNDRSVGLFAGFEYAIAPNMALSAEARGGTTNAVNVGFKYSF